MRTIKFRGKDKKGNWVYGYLSYSDNEEIHYIGVQEIMTPVITETVGQFTGHFDVNGNEIYEGDVGEISSLLVGVKEVGFKGVVKYYESAFWIDGGTDAHLLWSDSYDFVITGNIHDQ